MRGGGFLKKEMMGGLMGLNGKRIMRDAGKESFLVAKRIICDFESFQCSIFGRFEG